MDLESNHEYLVLDGIFSNISSDTEQITVSFELSGTNTIDYISKRSSVGRGTMKNGGGIMLFLL